MPATAEQLYEAFREACPVDDDGAPLPDFGKLPGGARGWFAIVNEIERIAAPPSDTSAPTVVPVEIPERVASTGVVIVESPRERPSTLTLRAHRADDMRVRQDPASEEFEYAVFARLVGVELRTIMERMDIADVEAYRMFCHEAAGTDCAQACCDVYHAADPDGPRLTSNHGAMLDGWRNVALVLMIDIDGNVAAVRCRTPGVGTIKIGPLRIGHLTAMRQATADAGEWAGRLVGVSRASGISEATLRDLRLEDAVAVWVAFATLKKKADERTAEKIVERQSLPSSTGSTSAARLSSQSSAASPPTSSTG
jgi:hypothetical protein